VRLCRETPFLFGRRDVFMTSFSRGEQTVPPVTHDDALSPEADDPGDYDQARRDLAPPAVQPDAPAGWLTLVRPATLVFAMGPVAATLLLIWAGGARLSALVAVCSLVAVVLTLAGANMLDEYLDYERSANQGGPVLRGPQAPPTALEASSIAPLDALRASLALLVAGAVVGVPLMINGGPVVLALGALAIATGVVYSATGYALKRLPAGELAVALAFGPALVAGTLVAQRQPVRGADLLLGLAFGLYALALLEMTHLRDAATDRLFRRHTLVLLLGERGGKLLVAACLIGAFVAAGIVALQHGVYHGAIGALLALPAATIPLTGALRARTTRTRQLAVGQAFRSASVFALWMCCGFLVAGAVVRLYPVVRDFLGM
jgi:1,4-dihydroxy-2-naphthoate octaprenyltransferase